MEDYKERFYDEFESITCGDCGACNIPPDDKQADPPIGWCPDGAGWVFLGQECRL